MAIATPSAAGVLRGCHGRRVKAKVTRQKAKVKRRSLVPCCYADQFTAPVYAVASTMTPNTMRYQANTLKSWVAM